MMQNKISAGRFWTLLSVECFLTKRCNKKCKYYNYCKRASGKIKPFILKQVVLKLFAMHGSPPVNLVKQVEKKLNCN